MTNNSIPDWLVQPQEYNPPKDNSRFITATQRAVISLISKFKLNAQIKKTQVPSTTCRLFGILLMIVLTAASRNFTFVLLMLGLCAVRIALLNAQSIRSLLRVVVPALIFSFIILLPSVFMGHPRTMLSVIGRVAVSTSLVTMLNLTAPFYSITGALKAFRVPDIVIFTFDITIKYILLFGEICNEMLTTLKVRSVGKNDRKSSSVSGVLGAVFVKARQAGDETVRAMECRGFCGKYVVSQKYKPSLADFLYTVMLLLITGIFIYLEVII